MDAWRRLCQTYEPTSYRANIWLLRRILSPPRGTVETFRSQLDRLESDTNEYVAQGRTRPTDDAMKIDEG